MIRSSWSLHSLVLLKLEVRTESGRRLSEAESWPWLQACPLATLGEYNKSTCLNQE